MPPGKTRKLAVESNSNITIVVSVEDGPRTKLITISQSMSDDFFDDIYISGISINQPNSDSNHVVYYPASMMASSP